MKPIIKKGDKYSRLTAIRFDHRGNHGRQYWLFKCDCGNEKVIQATNVKLLKSKSCGCNRKGCQLGQKRSEETRERMRQKALEQFKDGMPEKTKKKISETAIKLEVQKGKNNPMYGKLEEKSGHWKGDDVKYPGLHSWVTRRLGKPTKCEDCGEDGLSGKQIHWSNVDHKYHRAIEDWNRRCVKCHWKYDRENGLR